MSIHLILDLDPSDSSFATFTGYGRRIDALLNKPKVASDGSTAGTLDEFLGALYALALAHARTDSSIGLPEHQSR